MTDKVRMAVAVALGEQMRLVEEQINQGLFRICDTVAELIAYILRHGGFRLPDDPATGEPGLWIPAAEITGEHVRALMLQDDPRVLQ
jgi:hypothetical protein